MGNYWYRLSEIGKDINGEILYILYGYDFYTGKIVSLIADVNEGLKIIEEGRNINFNYENQYLLSDANSVDAILEQQEKSEVQYIASYHDIIRELVICEGLYFSENTKQYKSFNQMRVSKSTAFVGFSLEHDKNEWHTEAIIYNCPQSGEIKHNPISVAIPTKYVGYLQQSLNIAVDDGVLEYTIDNSENKKIWDRNYKIIYIKWIGQSILREYIDPYIITSKWLGYLATAVEIQRKKNILFSEQIYKDKEEYKAQDYRSKIVAEPYTIEVVYTTPSLNKNDFLRAFKNCTRVIKDEHEFNHQLLQMNTAESSAIKDMIATIKSLPEINPFILKDKYLEDKKYALVFALELAHHRCTFREMLDERDPEGTITTVLYKGTLNIKFVRKGKVNV